MLVAGELYGPARYAWYWLPLGGALLSLVAFWYCLVFWKTRSRTQRVRPRNVAGIRSRYHERIADVGRHSTAGAMSVREAHLRLSELVRGYVSEVGPLPARTMTLDELQAAGTVPPVAAAIGAFYPSEFDVDPSGDPAMAVVLAHRVVEDLP